mgnify:FL=1
MRKQVALHGSDHRLGQTALQRGMDPFTDQSQALIGFGQVRHQRTRPSSNTFTYANYFVWLPMRTFNARGSSALPRNRWSALSFFDSDHGDGADNALQWLDTLLKEHGLSHCTGQAWLHTYPRVWGYTFKPVSFWYCHTASGELGAVVVEVNNTFGERHIYVLPQVALGKPILANKSFHVSPFCEVRGEYRFTFMHRFDRSQALDPRSSLHTHPSHTVARIEYDDQAIARGRTPTLLTSVSGQLEPLHATTRQRALWRYPLMTAAVMVRIHWQALVLWRKRVPFISKTKPPATAVTRAHADLDA